MSRKDHCYQGELGRLHSCCGWNEYHLASSWENGVIVRHELARLNPEVPNHGRFARKVEEVDASLSSLAEMDFSCLFPLGEPEYDGFCKFCRRPNPGGSSSDSECSFGF
ncbi:unnamed protein product [Lactuca saligna]|uniref:Uncharacterized protein n=1 Tax=Lactuca saligna TaxID=75948 RepID=A0AA36ERK0_LACSI|nr:unnamed protein product [Lactuca saligna]